MKKARTWVALPAIAGLLIAYTTVAQAATGDTVRATGGGWFQPTVLVPPPPPPPPPPPTDPGVEPSALFPTDPFPAAGGNNTKCNFGFVASATDLGNGSWEYEGELSYHDHGKGLRLHSIDVTDVSVTGADAYFKGTAEVTLGNNATSIESFEVHVHDGDTNGTADTFDILLGCTLPDETSPYHRAGSLSGTGGGGKIQTHN
jgi:hypothetical protein